MSQFENMAAAERTYDRQQSPDYYDTRTDAEIEADMAERVAALKVTAPYLFDEQLWASVAEKMKKSSGA